MCSNHDPWGKGVGTMESCFFFNIEMNLEKYLWKFSQKPVRHKKKPETCVKT